MNGVPIKEECVLRHIYPSLVLVQPRKTHPYITERLLMGCKESNQANDGCNMVVLLWYDLVASFTAEH